MLNVARRVLIILSVPVGEMILGVALLLCLDIEIWKYLYQRLYIMVGKKRRVSKKPVTGQVVHNEVHFGIWYCWSYS